uniref:Uncharacterized protein n=1 Tax=Avena sativa TaxID=4498 RepID=A0ACD5UKH4_AVESA
MLPLEYLGSLGDSKLVCEYDWSDQIFRHTMSGIKCFQERCRKAKKARNTNPLWADGCLPWIAIVYMDHLDFPVSTLSTYRINDAIPRASNISDADFMFVVKHDKNKLTLIPNTYGVRPFRPFNATPYAVVDANIGSKDFEASILPQPREAHPRHSGQDASQQHTTQTLSSPEDLPEYLRTIQEKYNNLWKKGADRLTKIHDNQMTQFASELYATIKQNVATLDGLASPPRVPMPAASPPSASTPINSSPISNQPVFAEGVHNSDPTTTPNTQFWVEASKIADEVEQSASKSANTKDPSTSSHHHMAEESVTATTRTIRRGDDIECPSFDLLPPGETWSQQFVTNNQHNSDSVRNGSTPSLGVPIVNSGTVTHPVIQVDSTAKKIASKASTPEDGQYGSSSVIVSKKPPSPNECQLKKLCTQPGEAIQKGPGKKCVATTAPTHSDKHNGSPEPQYSQLPSSPNDGQPSQLVPCTVGTQTQEKKNRKKRAFLGINDNANQKILKKLKTTDVSKEIYDTYILRRCIRPPLDGEERPPFVDFGKYHISYEDFREALN